MLFFLKSIRSKNASIVGGLLGVLFLGLIVVVTSTFLVNRSKVQKIAREKMEYVLQVDNGIETFMVSYRLSELKYTSAVIGANCLEPHPFNIALKEGSNCSSAGTISVFTGEDSGTRDNLYTYSGSGCRISDLSTNCSAAEQELLTMGLQEEEEKVDNNSYIFRYLRSTPEKGIVEFVMIFEPAAGSPTKEVVFVQANLGNLAHFESAGQKVTQEEPNPLAKCKGDPFGTMYILDPEDKECKAFVELGGGTGMAFYNGRFFGFRPNDGQVIDLLKATNSDTYLVQESGFLAGEEVFVKYNKDVLINVDDIAVVGDTVYYAGGFGQQAQIGALRFSGTRWSKVKVCDLGGKGWAQAIDGLVAHNYSEDVLEPGEKLAAFYIKTSGGDFLTVVVVSDDNRTPRFSCLVYKDPNQQEIEYKRTLGFDRAEDIKPYYLQ